MDIISLNNIRKNVFNNLETEFNLITKKLSDSKLFISEFNNYDFETIKGYCFSTGVNPFTFIKHFYCNNLSELKSYLLSELNVDDIILIPNYETGNLNAVLSYKEQDILKLNILEKTYDILEDKTLIKEKELLHNKIDTLKKDISFFEEILIDDKKLKNYYSLNRLGILNIMNIKSKQKALLDANHKYTRLKEEMRETTAKINLLLKKSDSKTNMLELTIKRLQDLKYIEFNSIKSKV